MQITMKRLGILTLAICLLAALMFGWHSVAQAASWWPPSKDYQGCELTVYASEKKDIQKDLASVGAYVNLFKVADAKAEDDYEAFKYEYVAAFGDGPVPTPGVDDADAKEKWQEIAREAALVVEKGDSGAPTGSGDFLEPGYNVKMSKLDDGIYLAVILSHEPGTSDWAKDESGSATGSTTIKTARNEYTFMPQLVALPSKDPYPKDGPIASSNPGPWLTELTINLKPDLKDRYGSLVIKKNVVNDAKYSIKPVSFLFHVTGIQPDGTAYGPNGEGNYVTIQYSGGESATETLEHILAGTELTVTELPLSEASWGLKSDNDQKVTILGDGKTEVSTVEFTNEYKPAKGFAVNNEFELQKIGDDTDDWDWVWTQVTPESVRTEPTG
ncbi:MAG: hypothetical protein IJH88_01445 [Eggerthellaceae bacterium]|nr:hypothetical protein [Eggerthellaceae bacterium]